MGKNKNKKTHIKIDSKLGRKKSIFMKSKHFIKTLNNIIGFNNFNFSIFSAIQ